MPKTKSIILSNHLPEGTIPTDPPPLIKTHHPGRKFLPARLKMRSIKFYSRSGKSKVWMRGGSPEYLSRSIWEPTLLWNTANLWPSSRKQDSGIMLLIWLNSRKNIFLCFSNRFSMNSAIRLSFRRKRFSLIKLSGTSRSISTRNTKDLITSCRRCLRANSTKKTIFIWPKWTSKLSWQISTDLVR